EGYQDFLSYPRTPMASYHFDETQPLTFSVSFRSSSHGGTLEIRVTTLDPAGTTTGFGRGMAEIDRNNVTNVTVPVMRGAAPLPPLDAGVEDRKSTRLNS